VGAPKVLRTQLKRLGPENLGENVKAKDFPRKDERTLGNSKGDAKKVGSELFNDSVPQTADRKSPFDQFDPTEGAVGKNLPPKKKDRETKGTTKRREQNETNGGVPGQYRGWRGNAESAKKKLFVLFS